MARVMKKKAIARGGARDQPLDALQDRVVSWVAVVAAVVGQTRIESASSGKPQPVI